MAWTAPTTRTTGELITASIWNTDMVNNLAYLKNAPTFDGAVTVTGALTVNGATATFALSGSATQQWKMGVVSTDTYLYGYSGTQKVLRHSNGVIRTFSGGASGWGVNDAAETTTLMSLTDTGVLSVVGFGTHAFSAGGTGGNTLSVTNPTAGAGNYGRINIGADTSTVFQLNKYSTTFSPSSYQFADGANMVTDGAGGFSLVASHASGVIRFFTGGVTEQARFGTTGLFTLKANLATYGLEGDGTNGLGIAATHASGEIRFYARGTAQWGSFTNGGTSGSRFFALDTYDNGSSYGPSVSIARNSNASTPSAGFIQIMDRGTNWWRLWPDNTGVLRIGSTFPTNANDTSGTVVGTQTSTRASKRILSQFRDTKRALRELRKTPLYRFVYKNGAYNKQQFVGITTDDSPVFGMDKGRSFNPVSAFGYTVAAIQELARQIDALKQAIR